MDAIKDIAPALMPVNLGKKNAVARAFVHARPIVLDAAFGLRSPNVITVVIKASVKLLPKMSQRATRAAASFRPLLPTSCKV